MAIFHLHVKTIKRSAGRSATAACAYRAGEAIRDFRTGELHDYTRRVGVSDTFMLFGAGVPVALQAREALWNAAEMSERRKDAVVAREMILALPHELNREQRRALVTKMGQYLVWQLGVAADVAIHEPCWRRGHDIRNHHAHIMFTTRVVDANGFGEKTRVMDTRPSGPQMIQGMRRAWQDYCNEALEAAGYDSRVDCRTLVQQGIFDRIAQIHKGPKVQAMLDRGVNPANIFKLEGLDDQQAQESGKKKHRIPYDQLDQGRNRGQWNDEIVETNVIRANFGSEPLEVTIKKLIANIESLMHTMADLEAFIPRNLLPEWVIKKIEWAWIKAIALMRFFQEEKEEEIRQHEEREGRHAQMRRIKEQIAQLLQELRRKEGLQRLYVRIEHHIVTRPTEYAAPAIRPVRELTNYQYKVELHFKAETARAAVPPEYRPRIERPPAPSSAVHAAASDTGAGKGFLAQAMPAAPRDNGGLAALPPPITVNFNIQANPPAVQPYKQKVSIGFGPA